MKCGREPGGKHVPELEVCPAAVEEKLNGIHKGTNGGRTCWLVAGTMCEGDVQGTFARKFKSCQNCTFFRVVKLEEGDAFMSDVKSLLEYF
jgi:hypothetical protein